jgi:hypothetical protein
VTPCSLVHTCRYFVINYDTKFRHFWVACEINVDFTSHRSGNTKKSNQILEAKGKIQCEIYVDDINCKGKIQQCHRYSVWSIAVRRSV